MSYQSTSRTSRWPRWLQTKEVALLLKALATEAGARFKIGFCHDRYIAIQLYGAWMMTQDNDPERFSFEKHIWKDFHPERAIEALLTEDQSIYALQEILFESLSTWCIAPEKSLKIYKYALVNKAFAAAVQVERKAAERREIAGLSHIDPVKLRRRERKFLTDIYVPIGGLRTIGAAVNGATLRTLLRDQVKYIVPVLRVFTLFHAYNDVSIKNNSRATQQKCMKFLGHNAVDTPEILSSIPDNAQSKRARTHSERKIQESFVRLRASACLLYAAANTADDQGTLIEAIVNRQPSRFKRFRPHLQSWFGKALYVHENVLPKRHKNVGVPWQCPVSSNHVAALPFAGSQLPEDQVAKMLEEFSEPSKL